MLMQMGGAAHTTRLQEALTAGGACHQQTFPRPACNLPMTFQSGGTAHTISTTKSRCSVPEPCSETTHAYADGRRRAHHPAAGGAHSRRGLPSTNISSPRLQSAHDIPVGRHCAHHQHHKVQMLRP